MRCDEFEIRLNEALDARLEPEGDDVLSRHLLDCDRCRQLAAAYSAISETLRWADQPEPDEGLAEVVLARVSAVEANRSGGWSVWTHAALATAAALLIAVFLQRDQADGLHQPELATLDSPEQALAQLEPSDPTPLAGHLAREATARYATLARSTSDSLAGIWALWQPSASDDPNEPSSGELPLLAEMAAGLRPLADSTTGAVQFLWDVLPQRDARVEPPTSDPVNLSTDHTAT